MHIRDCFLHKNYSAKVLLKYTTTTSKWHCTILNNCMLSFIWGMTIKAILSSKTHKCLLRRFHNCIMPVHLLSYMRIEFTQGRDLLMTKNKQQGNGWMTLISFCYCLIFHWGISRVSSILISWLKFVFKSTDLKKKYHLNLKKL